MHHARRAPLGGGLPVVARATQPLEVRDVERSLAFSSGDQLDERNDVVDVDRGRHHVVHQAVATQRLAVENDRAKPAPPRGPADRLGLCLDSCHWWASGVDVTDPSALEEALEDLDDRIGLDRVRLLHANDSQTPLGSNRDRHELVGKGLLGQGLGTFLGHPAFKELPAITETWEDAGEATGDLDRMRELRRRGVRRWSARRRRLA